MTQLQAHPSMSAPHELRKLAGRLRFWIVGGTFTGAAFVVLGVVLGLQKLRPPETNPAWLPDLGVASMISVAFGIVVWVHALDVWRDRRTLLRVARELQAERGGTRPPVPEREDDRPA